MKTTSFFIILIFLTIFYIKVETKDYVPVLSGCGIQKHHTIEKEQTILPGDARIGEFPWTVRVKVLEETTYVAGSLIHPKVVLTTAFYLYGKNPGDLRVYAGEWKQGESTVEYPVQKRRVERIVRHSEYSLENSIALNGALLFLNEPVVLVEHINTICLPEKDMTDNRNDCIESGWVKLQNGSLPITMKKTLTKMIDDNECTERIEKVGSSRRVDTMSLCGLYIDENICWTKSGSSLACPITKEGSRFELAGMANWALLDDKGCITKDTPRGYTYVSKLRPWIETEMKKAGLNLTETS